MASPLKFAEAAGFLCFGLLCIAGVCTVRIRNTSMKTEASRADIVESEKARRESLWGAGLFAVISLVFLVIWAL